MKVAYIINQYPKVSHSFIRREILALEEQGFQIERISIRGWKEVLPDPDDQQERRRTRYVLREGVAGVAVALFQVAIFFPRRTFSALMLALRMARWSNRSVLFNLAYLLEATVVARWVRNLRINHLHAHFGTNSTEVAMLAGLLVNVGYSFTAHGPEEFDRPESLGLGEKIKRATFVAAISSFGKAQLCRWVDVKYWEKIRIVRCGLDASFLNAKGKPATNNRIVCVGRLCEQKGQLVLISALKGVIEAGHSCELVMAGDGEFRDLIETAIRNEDLGLHVRITGWIDSSRVREELLSARALVLPSFAEGLPVVLMEAMALRRPVISTYIAGIPELVTDGKNGWLVASGDVEALARAIVDCLEASEEKLEKMGELGREQVVRMHDVRCEASKLGKFFLEAPKLQ